MGCGVSKSPRVYPAGPGSGERTWSVNYEETARKLSQRHRDLMEKLSQVRDPSGAAVIEKDGSQLARVNGFKIVRPLGRGAFGEVFLAQQFDDHYAIKVLRKSALKKLHRPGPGVAWGRGRTIAAVASVKTEIAMMKKIEHPNCVHIYDVILDPACDEVFLVIEYVDGGPSQKFDADGRPIPLPESEIWSYLRHLTMGLEYLHMHAIIHRDIKPENLLLAKTPKLGQILKIADFGTSCLCEGDANAQRTAGTPAFFSPERCTTEASGTYDGRVVDLWAVGVTIFLWVCGWTPYTAPTTALLMETIANAPERAVAPEKTSPGLASVIEGLLTREVATRLTLVQLRLHEWLTEGGTQPLPPQPIMKIQVTPAEIEQAFTNRKAVAVGSAAGPSALGKALAFVQHGDGSSTSPSSAGAAAGWLREGESTIRKRSNEAEAKFYRAIGASGNLAPHIPATYSIGPADVLLPDGSEAHDIVMEDLVAGMTRPCAMALVMGTRTVTAADLAQGEARADLLRAVDELDPNSVMAVERERGGLTQARYLAFLDARSSTSTLGFRLDSAKTMVNGKLDALPLPEGVELDALREESHVSAAIAKFVQHDTQIANALFLKLKTLLNALQQSKFFPKHAFLRTTLLFVYDDANRANVQIRIMNFSAAYALPEGEAVSHDVPWDSTAECHEDGYLIGVHSLVRIMTVLSESQTR
ncbi:calcium calmodulin-dependent protein kinase kinase 1 [Chrysochromulina tobinii]|uniref:Calcium calmodulin-dependent protein kinase kinase 1 n=1 Tax=Chrysochromulina tobinii TaxID=1460289 RepID=A0A0M0J2U8_9EUKA|nr:calcium calmodulin-dependent protein kinase kinase 1 [Chrysochromulina tobinii]|eukprot:KOO20850.1 calcium calmodulin-dependent protein kinase kinase 1 [Chrysochromulina sp. CCMP291]